MEAILPLLLFAGAFFLMMRFGCGAHAGGHRQRDKHAGGCCGSGHGHGAHESPGTGQGQESSPEKKADPVCGKSVSWNEAKFSVHGGEVYHFCGRDCREAFEAAPHLYVPVPADHLEVTRLAIEGMSCTSCVSHIEGALRKAPGVISAHVDFTSASADVTHQPGGVSADALAKVVRKTGYDAVVATAAWSG